MPEYGYRCAKCGKSFNLVMGVIEHEKAKVKCPKCSSSTVVQKVSAFVPITSKKS